MLKHSEPPKRQNSNQRTVNVAHVTDIVDAMYKADAAGECFAGAVANVADSDRCRCNPKVPSSIPAGGKDFP